MSWAPQSVDSVARVATKNRVLLGDGRVITDDLGRPWTLPVAGQYQPILGKDGKEKKRMEQQIGICS